MKKAKKQIKGLALGTIGLGVGSQVLGGIGGNVAAQGQLGMTRVAGAFPTVGTLIGTGLTLRALKELEKAGKKIKRR